MTLRRETGLKAFASLTLLVLTGFVLLQLSFFLSLTLCSATLAQENRFFTSSKLGNFTSTVRGTVRIESKIPSKSFPLNLYSRQGRSRNRNQQPSPVNEIENVVVYLEDTDQNAEEASNRQKPLAESQPAIRQLNEMFIPHVLPIVVGTTVQFPNEDPFFHNVFSLSSTKSFDLGRYPKNHTRLVKFDQPGIVKVFCHIHSHMNAVILVFDHPYFCVPEAKGNFVIGDIPPGRYTLVAWHERLKPYKQVVNIVPGTQLSIDVVL